jgi:hypothetical protein
MDRVTSQHHDQYSCDEKPAEDHPDFVLCETPAHPNVRQLRRPNAALPGMKIRWA